MNKAICITFNTAIDLVVEVDDFEKGTTFRSTSCVFVPAGKGVDVAIGVAALGRQAIAAGFVGIENRQVFDGLAHEGVDPMFVEVPGATRTNITIAEPKGRETHIQTTGFKITTKHVEQLVSRLEGCLLAGDVVVLAGSLPPGVPSEIYRDLVALFRSKGAFVALDSSGEALAQGVLGRPHLIKPNMQELSGLLNAHVENDDLAVLQAAEECLAQGADSAVVTRGRLGALSVEPQRSYKVWVDVGRSAISAGVGSGDATVAGIVYGILEGWTRLESVRIGVAAAAASLFTRFPGRFTRAEAEDVASRVQVQELVR